MAPTLGYWDIRGLAEPIRYLLHYKGEKFEDKRYTSYETWVSEKFNLELDFPNLPYYIDGNVRLTQSMAILRYLAKKHNLAGSTESETLRILVAEQQLIDLRTNLVKLAYNPNYEKQKEEFIKSLPDQVKLWAKFIGNKKFIAGENLTYVDFLAYETFDFYELFLPSIYQEHVNLKEYMKRFESLPQLQTYFKSSTYKRWPIFGPIAKFGGTGEEPKKL